MLYRSHYIKINSSKKVLSCLITVILLICLFGCSSTHRYKTLSFFFDGVPKPDNEIAVHKLDSLTIADSTVIAQNSTPVTKPLINFHPPYKEKECASCHDQSSMGKLNKTQPELCYQCHDDFSTKYKKLHGPVAGGQCTMCHSPHMSKNENLLLRIGQDLCFHCHNSEQILAEEQHKDIQDASCTECHNPHGGDDKNILR